METQGIGSRTDVRGGTRTDALAAQGRLHPGAGVAGRIHLQRVYRTGGTALHRMYGPPGLPAAHLARTMTGWRDRNVEGILWRRTAVDTERDATVLAVLREAGHPLPARAIGEKAGIRSTASVRRILRRLKAAGTVTQLECRECGETEYVAR